MIDPNLSKSGVTFTRKQKLMIYCLRDNLNFFGKIKKWLIQKFILNREKRAR
jgi:hypothetical protein